MDLSDTLIEISNSIDAINERVNQHRLNLITDLRVASEHILYWTWFTISMSLFGIYHGVSLSLQFVNLVSVIFVFGASIFIKKKAQELERNLIMERLTEQHE